MIAGLPYTALRDAVFTHPTLPEGLISLFSAVPARRWRHWLAPLSGSCQLSFV